MTSPTSENLNWEFVLSLNSWNLNLNLRGYISHVVSQKKPVYRPLEEKWRTKRLSCLLSHRKQKEVTEKSKGKKKRSNQIKRVKGERMNDEAWRSVLAAQWRKAKAYSTWYSQWSPIQVLTRPQTLLSFRDRRDRACSGWYGP